ncbi:hypothetical protein RHECNPAF_6420052 [Rhizobium etli CNPAF512]|nr:hypothetical protein RHECNPAF_6420052 [Rhizobium etli CNPAF512]
MLGAYPEHLLSVEKAADPRHKADKAEDDVEWRTKQRKAEAAQPFVAASSPIGSFPRRRCILLESRYGFQPADNLGDIRPPGEIEAHAAGADRLREEEDIGNTRPVADGEGALPAAADHSLDRGHSLANPVTAPGSDSIGIRLKGCLEMQADPRRQQRVDLGSDCKRNRAGLRPAFSRIGQQRRLGLNLIEIFDDCQRLGDEDAVIRQQGRHQPLRIDAAIAGLPALGVLSENAHWQRLDRQSLERQRDPDSRSRRGNFVLVEFH